MLTKMSISVEREKERQNDFSKASRTRATQEREIHAVFFLVVVEDNDMIESFFFRVSL